jgi:hypothetical protein
MNPVANVHPGTVLIAESAGSALAICFAIDLALKARSLDVDRSSSRRSRFFRSRTGSWSGTLLVKTRQQLGRQMGFPAAFMR